MINNKISESELSGKDISSISGNVVSGKADWLKARFDSVSEEVVIPHFNTLVDGLLAPTAAGEIGSENGTVQMDLTAALEEAEAALNKAGVAIGNAETAVSIARTAELTANDAKYVDFCGEVTTAEQALNYLENRYLIQNATLNGIKAETGEANARAADANAEISDLKTRVNGLETIINPDTGRLDTVENVVFMLYQLMYDGGMTAEAFNTLNITASQFNALNITAAAFNNYGIA